MKIMNPEKRLGEFWGRVDEKQVSSMMGFMRSGTVLDVGCGYGSTTAYLNRHVGGIRCVGLDLEHGDVRMAKRLFPANEYICASAEQLPFRNGSVDAIVVRDAIHHLTQEADWPAVQRELSRVARPGTLLILYDPNINTIIRTMRRLAFHRDPECNYESAMAIVNGMGLEIVTTSFNTLFSLPLSGGYVGINLIPNQPWLWRMILWSEAILEQWVNQAGIGRHLCWRYLIVAQWR